MSLSTMITNMAARDLDFKVEASGNHYKLVAYSPTNNDFTYTVDGYLMKRLGFREPWKWNLRKTVNGVSQYIPFIDDMFHDIPNGEPFMHDDVDAVNWVHCELTWNDVTKKVTLELAFYQISNR
jgi:hypothetical protein